jgi:hypothetical protein
MNLSVFPVAFVKHSYARFPLSLIETREHRVIWIIPHAGTEMRPDPDDSYTTLNSYLIPILLPWNGPDAHMLGQ